MARHRSGHRDPAAAVVHTCAREDVRPARVLSHGGHEKEDPVRLTMTVIDTRVLGPRSRHVTIEAPSGTRFGEIRSELTDVAGVPGCGFRAGGRLVTDDALVGAPPLLRGCAADRHPAG